MTVALNSLGAARLALRMASSPRTAFFVIYLVPPGEAAGVVAEIEAELGVLAKDVTVRSVRDVGGAASLLRALPQIAADVLLVTADTYSSADWRLLDRRRSTLAREGAVVLVTTQASFDELMHVAPHLASWLGGLAFSYEDPDAQAQAQIAPRLAALQAWSGKSDAEVLAEAEEGRLPRDPEYAEWLVLLGRGDLLDAR